MLSVILDVKMLVLVIFSLPVYLKYLIDFVAVICTC